MKIINLITQAVRHPKAALKGIIEFRSDVTTSFEDYDQLESYDSGRELAHKFTFRRFDQTA